ncbi:MAG: TIGR02265 family protein [Acidobacteria bacterium]|nr:MAG: TIGR02265 family protein [Acidobacteriota bacterium]
MAMKIKGAVLTSRKTFVEGNFGADAWSMVLRSLSAEDQKFYSGLLLAAGWYPFEYGDRLDKAIVQVLGRGNYTVFEAIGAQSAKDNLTKLHHNFLAPGDPQAFLAKTSLIYSFYYNSGRREYQPTGPNSGVMTTYDADTFSEADCYKIIGWHKEALEMCGAYDITIRHDICRAKGGPYCQYTLSWKI